MKIFIIFGFVIVSFFGGKLVPKRHGMVSALGPYPNNKECKNCVCDRNIKYAPLCATNGKIYLNDCKFKCALKCGNPNLKIVRRGDSHCQEDPMYLRNVSTTDVSAVTTMSPLHRQKLKPC